MTVIPAAHSDLSPPLRDQPVVWPQAGKEREHMSTQGYRLDITIAQIR